MFEDLEPGPANHFKLYFYAATLRLLEQAFLACGSPEAAFEQFPFLVGYHNALAERGLEGCAVDDALQVWHTALTTWEERAAGHLPLRALRETAGLNPAALTAWMMAGLVEEDARFGAVFETLQGVPDGRRLTGALLAACSAEDDSISWAAVNQLEALGLLEVLNPGAPRAERTVRVPSPVWEAARGEVPETPAPNLRYRPPNQLFSLSALIVPESLRATLNALPRLVRTGEIRWLMVRGPRHNSRRTLLGVLARDLGLGLLEVRAEARDAANQEAPTGWSFVGPLATLLNALPVFVFDLALGEQVELADLPAYAGVVGVVMSKQGNVLCVGPALTLNLDIPDVVGRRQFWQAGLEGFGAADLDQWSAQFRMAGGHLQQLARAARTRARLEERNLVTTEDVLQAGRALNRQALEALTTPVEALAEAWGGLCVQAETLEGLRLLESRCRHRERLGAAAGVAFAGQWNAGVRALFSGPSGTGKTLAARALAAALGLDLYRLDLASLVSKYIGETEKNLSQVFARAEELGVILLLDEGDALLTNRTSVHNSNDRYANLETNYLLQRLESYDGLLIVTTNAGDRIDGAFQRRMDVIIQFRAPEASERQAIWELHLPAAHAIDPVFMREVVYRCDLTGGQIRNAALHASLLALNDGGVVTTHYLEAAVQREYRKLGAVCPLRRV